MKYFVGVGAQKAGTTWLHDQLVLHPQVALPERKEVHYFDSVCPTRTGSSFGRFYTRRIRKAIEVGRLDRVENLLEVLDVIFTGDRAYREYLGRTAGPETRVIGEITPGYAGLEQAGFDRMRDALDDPRIVFVMRDPLSRYWSAVRMGTPDPDRLVSAFETLIDMAGHWARCDYETTIRILDDTFSEVLYLFYEDLFNETTLRRLATFLGVDEVWNWDLEHTAMVGVARDMPEVPDRVRERLAGVYEFVRARFGDEVPGSWVM